MRNLLNEEVIAKGFEAVLEEAQARKAAIWCDLSSGLKEQKTLRADIQQLQAEVNGGTEALRNMQWRIKIDDDARSAEVKELRGRQREARKLLRQCNAKFFRAKADGRTAEAEELDREATRLAQWVRNFDEKIKIVTREKQRQENGIQKAQKTLQMQVERLKGMRAKLEELEEWTLILTEERDAVNEELDLLREMELEILKVS